MNLESIHKLVNETSGWIGLISFILSILIAIRTSDIRKEITKKLKMDKYIDQKNRSLQRLNGIIKSMDKDNLFDEKLVNEIVREVSMLKHYKSFMDKHTRKNYDDLSEYIAKEFSLITRVELNRKMNRLAGDLSIKEVRI